MQRLQWLQWLKKEMQVKPFECPVSYGWFCWCYGDDFNEPEGTIYFDCVPKVGEKIKLSDNREWTITRVDEHNTEIHVRQ